MVSFRRFSVPLFSFLCITLTTSSSSWLSSSSLSSPRDSGSSSLSSWLSTSIECPLRLLKLGGNSSGRRKWNWIWVNKQYGEEIPELGSKVKAKRSTETPEKLSLVGSPALVSRLLSNSFWVFGCCLPFLVLFELLAVFLSRLIG